jgi:hypothetical protein
VGSIRSSFTVIKQSEYRHHLCAEVESYRFCNSTENDLGQQPLEHQTSMGDVWGSSHTCALGLAQADFAVSDLAL